ncbi:hypothetical protein L7F22_052880 [Adiantum nelumboides]|nr:hypothetical protein [Adiantum nelumboides]
MVLKQSNSPRKRAKVEYDVLLTPPAAPKGKVKEEEQSPKTPKRVKKEPMTTSERKLASLRQSLKTEPFPQWNKPSKEEARQVAEILTKSHGYKTIPKKQPPKGDDRYGGCGDVSDVLDATVRTILSCNTSGANSRAAHKSLCDTFGKCNWQAILDAKHADVAASIKCGGLQDNKAKTIQGVLRQTQETHGKLSLNHLHGADARTVMEELVSFNGVGPKVASCVAMFALGLSEMAVDTHVHRLCRKLGWVPDKATRDQTYYHLAARIPDDLKYALHVLLIKHGKACAACSARGFATDRYASPDWEKEGMSVISGIKKEDWGMMLKQVPIRRINMKP